MHQLETKLRRIWGCEDMHTATPTAVRSKNDVRHSQVCKGLLHAIVAWVLTQCVVWSADEAATQQPYSSSSTAMWQQWPKPLKATATSSLTNRS